MFSPEEYAKMVQLTMNDTVEFRRVFLPVNKEYEPADFHYEWGKLLRHGKSHVAIEAFRESGKSSIIMAFIYQCLRFPETKLDFICIICNDHDAAKEKLKEISDEYINNPLFKANLVRVVQKNEDVFEIIATDVYGKEINVRIASFGKGTSIRGSLSRGRRPKVVIMDDVQGKKESMSPTLMERDWQWFIHDVYFLGEDDFRIFMIGNNLGEKCLIERVFAQHKHLKFKTRRIAVLNEDDEPTWPARHKREDIYLQRSSFESMGEVDAWFREKMCIPLSPDSQIFKKEMFNREFDLKEINISELSVYTAVDLAISQKDTADFTAIVTVGVNSDNHWFILDVRYGRFNPTQTIDEIFDVVSKYKPKLLGLEKVGYQAALEHFITIEMRKRNIWFEVKELKADNKKEERIRMLHPRFVAKTIWFPISTQDWIEEMQRELLAFPNSRHDDLIDALAYIGQIAKPPSRKSNNYYSRKNKPRRKAGQM